MLLTTEPTLQTLQFKFLKAFLLQLGMVVHAFIAPFGRQRLLDLCKSQASQGYIIRPCHKTKMKPGIVMHAFSPSTWGRSRQISELEASLVYIITRWTVMGT